MGGHLWAGDIWAEPYKPRSQFAETFRAEGMANSGVQRWEQAGAQDEAGIEEPGRAQ